METRSDMRSFQRRKVRELLGDTHRLLAFESAARYGSFTQAGIELDISQPAVSRHVAILEDRLNVALFRRERGRVSLTPAGETLLQATRLAFGALDKAVDEIRGHSSRLLLAVQPTIAESWFSPRLDELRAAVEPSTVHLVIFDRDEELETTEHDVAIRFDPELGPGSRSHPLVGEAVFPVASPELAEQLGLSPESPPADLLSGVRLLRIQTRGRPWLGWSDWFDALDIDWTPDEGDVVHQAYSVLLQQALAGQGVALAWDTLTGDLLQRRLLRRVGPIVQRTDRAYHLVWPASLARHDGLNRLRDWTTSTIDGLSREM